MKTKYFFLAVYFVLTNCKDDDPCAIPDGVQVDPINQQLSLELITANGDNLIDNGTYIESDIIVVYKDFEITNSVNRNFDSERKVINIGMPGTDKGANLWYIKLNEVETDTLLVSIEQEIGDCGSISYIPTSASYNGEEQMLDTLSESKYHPRITIVKTL